MLSFKVKRNQFETTHHIRMSGGSSSVSDQGAIMDGLDTAPAIINPTAADDAAPESPKAQMATTSTNISTMASSSTSQG